MANGYAIPPTDLLILPPPPSLTTFSNLKAAYRSPLATALRQLTDDSRHGTLGTILDIGLPCPQLPKDIDAPRASTFQSIQGLIAGVYKLLCVIAVEEGFNIEDCEGIDARIILLSVTDSDHVDSTQPVSPEVFGPVIDLKTLALCQRPWRSVFAVDGEEGEDLLKRFLVTRDTHMKVRRVPGGVVMTEPGASGAELPTTSAGNFTKHDSVILGGTFDHLHTGHKLLLTMFAFILQQGNSIQNINRCYTIGITNDAMLKGKKYAEMVEGWTDRQRSTATFMNAILDFRPPQDIKEEVEELDQPGPNGHAIHLKLGSHIILKFVEIQDPFGPTITVEDITAIVISAETRSGGQEVNKKRLEKGWGELEIFEVDVLDSEDPDQDGTNQQRLDKDTFESKLSSTKIRKALSERGKQRMKT